MDTMNLETRVSVHKACAKGELSLYLNSIPKDNWSIEHLARGCMNDDNYDAIKTLIQHGIDVNSHALGESASIVIAVCCLQPKITELLCAAGASFDVCDLSGNKLLACAVWFGKAIENDMTCAEVLVSNGARMSEMASKFALDHDVYEHFEAEDEIGSLLQLEYCVDQCRTAVVALLRVKDTGKLWQWDRFLLVYISHAVWATRTDNEWLIV